MAASDFAHDGSVILATLANPEKGLARAVARRRALAAILLSTMLSLVATALMMPTFDTEAIAESQLQPGMTPHEREVAIEQANKLFHVTTWAAAAAKPVGFAFAAAIVLWLAFWVAGARTAFKRCFTVAAHALVPLALRSLLSAPAAIAHQPIDPATVSTLLPCNLALLLPPSTPPLALAAAAALDVFTLWALVLAYAGMVKATGASKLRASLVMLVLAAAGIALFAIAPAAAGGH